MPQWIATTQFFLYGKENCTKTGYDKAVEDRKLKAKTEGKEYCDILDNYKKAYNDDTVDETAWPQKDHVYMVTGANAGIGFEIAQNLAFGGAT